MRRWFEFGLNPDGSLLYQVGEEGVNWSVVPPYFLSMPRKQDVYQTWNIAGNTADSAIYVQQMRLGGFGSDVAPAADCTALHQTFGYSAYGALTPLKTLILNGFYNKDFTSTPPLWRESFTKPSKNG
jgi:hypothetical protein